MKRRHLNKITLLTLAAASSLSIIFSCKEVPHYFDGSRVLAEVGSEKLYARDVLTVVPEELTGEDSAAVMERYVDRWMYRRLKLRAAKNAFSGKEEDAIDSLVEEYRQSLVVRMFDEQLVAQADTTVTDEQIEAYYREHGAEFRVTQTLVEGTVVRFDVSNRQAAKLRQAMAHGGEEGRQELRDLSAKNHFELTEFAEWVPWSEFLSYLPTLRNRSYDNLLTVGTVQEMREDASGYYFRITSVRRAGDTEPLSRTRETIRKILYNQRLQEIVQTREREMLDEAVKAGKAEIYAPRASRPVAEETPEELTSRGVTVLNSDFLS